MYKHFTTPSAAWNTTGRCHAMSWTRCQPKTTGRTSSRNTCAHKVFFFCYGSETARPDHQQWLFYFVKISYWTRGDIETDRGRRVMKDLYWWSVNIKGVSRPRLLHHHRDWRNEMKSIKWLWINAVMSPVAGGNRKISEGKPREIRAPAVGGERLTTCAKEPQS